MESWRLIPRFDSKFLKEMVFCRASELSLGAVLPLFGQDPPGLRQCRAAVLGASAFMSSRVSRGSETPIAPGPAPVGSIAADKTWRAPGQDSVEGGGDRPRFNARRARRRARGVVGSASPQPPRGPLQNVKLLRNGGVWGGWGGFPQRLLRVCESGVAS
ncbi:MAG: hypothetical protein BJ554DRAFT_7743 [Olpidium bornovanus]|uniref:Uncharacterized protein n=1 Tax=Olpidium bornovanus TaxID=278681 RepID=A0A8H7ZVK3_9FUNG|nr:MAG: hypothetical protein BJ554DRAFT_7743 [Olpidium bornovanus]